MKKEQHAVVVPFPAQGHINPMLNLATLLHSHHNFHITFVLSHSTLCHLLSATDTHHHPLPATFRFESIPDALPRADPENLEAPSGSLESCRSATHDMISSLCESMSTTCLPPFRGLLSRLNSGGVPPVTCVIADGVMGFALKAAAEVGVAAVAFWTMSACGFMGYVQFRELMERGLTPLPDANCLTNGYLDTQINWIPGMNNIRLQDLPFFVKTTSQDDFMLHFMASEIETTGEIASAIILNTFTALESPVLSSLSTIPHLPPVYPIGPLHLFSSQTQSSESESRPKSNPIRSNLWKEQPECIEWLDLHEPGSVLYVNFGSITTMQPRHLTEFAYGLADSKVKFLWVIRPDMIAGEGSLVCLPTEFSMETKDRGMVASWAPQDAVLRHRSVSAFLTHVGWNSTLCTGIPMVCWPFFGEQLTNSLYCCREWGVGIELASEVRREEVADAVREVVEGEMGAAIRRRIVKWKRLAEEAIMHPNGSSFTSLERLVHDVLVS